MASDPAVPSVPERLAVDGLRFCHVDVFADTPLSGNGLVVVLGAAGLEHDQMQRVTQEMRQFETIFLDRPVPGRACSARVFTVEEELLFAGHPVLGAAAVMHALLEDAAPEEELELTLAGRPLALRSRRDGGRFEVELDQGTADFGHRATAAGAAAFAVALGLRTGDLHPALPVQVVTTGLPYLIVPVLTGLDRAQIVIDDLEQRLADVGAKFVYVLDVAAREGRTWDNEGRVEDVATGSAAGPAAAYLVEHGVAPAGDPFVLRQGRFAGRPSRLRVSVTSSGVIVGGAVSRVADGTFRLSWDQGASAGS